MIYALAGLVVGGMIGATLGFFACGLMIAAKGTAYDQAKSDLAQDKFLRDWEAARRSR